VVVPLDLPCQRSCKETWAKAQILQFAGEPQAYVVTPNFFERRAASGKVVRGREQSGPVLMVCHLWDIVFTQESGQERLRGLGVPMPLKENALHETVLFDGSPKPVSNAIDARTDLVEMPTGTPSGFPLAQVFNEERSELDAPFANGFVTDLDAALVEQFLNVPIPQGKAVVEPNGVLDDGHGETVAVRLGVSHGHSASPHPVKATQPFQAFMDVSQEI